jgi:hypothetical protein
MGSLKPNAGLVYESPDGGRTIYAREVGADLSTRKVVGWAYDKNDPNYDPRSDGQKELADHNEWIKIRLAGKNNPALQKAIDRVKMLYKLSMEKYEQ